MKKLLFLFIVFNALLNLQVKAQTPCIKDGQNILNVYYGTDFSKQLMETNYAHYQNLTVSNTGNLGGVFEHVVNKRFGYGGEFGYSSTVASYRQDIYTSSYTPESYTTSHSLIHIRAQARVNFYFLCRKHYNGYYFFSGGYSKYTNVKSSNAPGAFNQTTTSNTPLGVKTGVGIRYFSDQLGLFAEFALGTPLLNIGLCAKF